jgi:hypothetical protein
MNFKNKKINNLRYRYSSVLERHSGTFRTFPEDAVEILPARSSDNEGFNEANNIVINNNNNDDDDDDSNDNNNSNDDDDYSHSNDNNNNNNLANKVDEARLENVEFSAEKEIRWTLCFANYLIFIFYFSIIFLSTTFCTCLFDFTTHNSALDHVVSASTFVYFSGQNLEFHKIIEW